MTIICHCPSCGARYQVAAEMAGRRAKCSQCSAPVTIPALPRDSAAGLPGLPPVPSPPPPAPPPPAAQTQAIVAPPPIEAPPPATFPDFGATGEPAAVSQPASPSPPSIAAQRKTKQAVGRAFWRGLALGGGGIVAAVGVALVIVFNWPHEASKADPAKAGGEVPTASNPAPAVPEKAAGEKPKPDNAAPPPPPPPPGKPPDPAPSVNVATLVINWPESERAGGRVYIDRQQRELPMQGEVSYLLPPRPSPYRIRLQRRGYLSNEFDWLARADRAAKPYRPVWIVLPARPAPPAGLAGSGRPSASDSETPEDDLAGGVGSPPGGRPPRARPAPPPKPTERPAGMGAEEFIRTKGLQRVEGYWVLTAEAELRKKIADSFRVKREIEKKGTAASKAEDNAQAAARAAEELQKRLRDLGRQLDAAFSAQIRFQIARALADAQQRHRALQAAAEQAKQEAIKSRAAANNASGEFAAKVEDLRRRYDDAIQEYRDLAAEPAVGRALTDYNRESDRKIALGPSNAFRAQDDKLRELESLGWSRQVAIRQGSGSLWYVDVTINGRPLGEMAIDTGASVIAMSWKAAQAAGLTPGPGDPQMRVHVADGRAVTGWRMKAKTVTVGGFTVRDVECTVLPPEMREAPLLLGQSFLKHFTYQIDMANHKLVLSHAGKAGEARKPRPGGKDTRPKPPAAAPEPDDEEEPAIAAAPKPAAAAGKTQQLLHILGGDEDQRKRVGQIRIGQDRPATVYTALPVPAATLRERFGPPDKSGTLEKKMSGDDTAVQRWGLQGWGPVRVLVDRAGIVRYFLLDDAPP